MPPIPARHPPAPHARGFSLLEAIIALVLISTTVMAAYGWINANLITAGRIQDIALQTEATDNILAFLENINPMLTPQGEQAFVDYAIRWDSELIEPERDVVNGLAGIGLHKIGLYRLRISVSKPNGAPWFELSWNQVGYRKVREPKAP